MPQKDVKSLSAAVLPTVSALMFVSSIFVSNVAGAATTTDRDCDRLARGLKSLHTPMPEPLTETLTIRHIDHESPSLVIDHGKDADELLKTDEHLVTPFLYLSPRVETVLNDIFDVEQSEAAGDESLGASSLHQEKATKPTVLKTAPVADADKSSTIDNADDSGQIIPKAAPDQAEDLPLFQRRMFRIDI